MGQDALLDYRMEAPHIPEVKDPNHCSTCDDEIVEGLHPTFYESKTTCSLYATSYEVLPKGA